MGKVKIRNNDWKRIKFSELVENYDRERIPIKASERKKSSNKNYPYYGASGIIDKVEDYIFNGDYLLISEDGANLLDRNYPIAFRVSGKFWVNNHAHIVKSVPDKTFDKYLEYYFSGISVADYVTGSAQPKLSQKKLNSIEIPLAPLPEQRAIVAKLDALFERIDAAIALVKENITHTEALMGSVLDEEFGRLELNFTVNDCCILNPKKSEVKELDDVTEVSFLPMRDLEENKMFFEVKEQKKLGEVYKGYTYFADNDVLLAKVTPCFENKKAGIANDLSNGIGFGSSEYHILRANEDVLPKWLYYTVLSEQFRLLGKLQMTGAGGLKRVPAKFLKAWPMPKPSLKEQEKIINKIERVHQNIDSISRIQKNKLEQLEGLKQSLLDVAFKGELV